MSRDIQDFVQGFGIGALAAGRFQANRRAQAAFDAANPPNPELEAFDQKYGTGSEGGFSGFGKRIGRTVGGWFGGSQNNPTAQSYGVDAAQRAVDRYGVVQVDQPQVQAFEDGGAVPDNGTIIINGRAYRVSPIEAQNASDQVTRNGLVNNSRGVALVSPPTRGGPATMPYIAPTTEGSPVVGDGTIPADRLPAYEAVPRFGNAELPNRSAALADRPAAFDRPMEYDGPGARTPVRPPDMTNLPPFETPLGREVDQSPGGAAPPPTSAVTRAGNATSTSGRGAGGQPTSAVSRKRLRDQTRTEAYDPELDKDDPDNVLRAALNGGITFATDAFHLGGGQAANGQDPRTAKGQRAFMQGVGAASPEDINALNMLVQQQAPDNYDGPAGQAKLAIRRMEIMYRHAVMNGQTDKANKMAFELLQYSAGEAARLGTMAVQKYKEGDVPGTVALVTQAYDAIPDGHNVTIGPDGKTAIVTDRQGRTVEEIKFTPEMLFNTALGLSNRSIYWQIIMNRAQMTSPALQKDGAVATKMAVDRKRIELMDARINRLKQPPGRGGRPAAGVGPAPTGIAAKLAAIDGVRGGGAPTPGVPQGDVADEEDEPVAAVDPAMTDALSDGESGEDEIEQGDNQSGAGAPPRPAGAPSATSVVKPAPASVLRTKPASPSQGVVTPVGKSTAAETPTPAPSQRVVQPPSSEPIDPATVPEQVIGDKPTREPQKAPDPRAQFGGKNPYTELLADPANTAEFATKQGRVMKSAIEKKARALDAEVRAWEKGNKDAQTRQDKAQKEALKGVYDKKFDAHQASIISKDIAEALEMQRTAEADEVKAGNKKPSVYTNKSVPDDTLHDITMSLITSNPNMPARTGLQIATSMLRYGDQDNEENLRAFKPLGRDPLGNIVVSVNNRQVHVRPETYDNINRTVQGLWAKDRDRRAAEAKKAKAWSDVGTAVRRSTEIPRDTPPVGALTLPYLTGQAIERRGNQLYDWANRQTQGKKPVDTPPQAGMFYR